MSRTIAASSEINGTIGASIGTTHSMFAWVKVADLITGSSLFLMQTSESGSGWVRKVYTLPSVVRLDVTGRAYQNFTPATADLHDGEWLPILVTYNPTDFYYYFYDSGTYTPLTDNHTQTDKGTEVFKLGGTANNRSIQVAECCLWDKVITSGQFDTLADTSGGNAVNPTTIETANVVSYISFRTDSLTEELGSGFTYTPTGTTTYSAEHPSVDAYSSSIQPSMAYLMNMMRG